MSFLSDSDFSSIRSVFDEIHDTFDQTIYIYKVKQKVTVATNPEFNAFYNSDFNKQKTIEEKTRVECKARIKYAQMQDERYLPNSEGSVPVSVGDLRIKIKTEDAKLIRQASDIEIDGEIFKLDSNKSKTGLFQSQYDVLYLRRKGG